MREESTLGGLTKAWVKRATNNVGDLPHQALVGSAHWAGCASTYWHLGRGRRQRALSPALAVIDGGREAPEQRGAIACINIFAVEPWTGDLLIERFLNTHATQLQFLDGFRQAILAPPQSNPDVYIAVTFWDSPAQAQAAPELPEDMQELILVRSRMLEIVGRKFRPRWDGIERRRTERRMGVDRRQAGAIR